MIKNRKVVNYDEVDYDYKTYWVNREYENEVEQIAIKSLMRDVEGGMFLDLGGSYG